MTNISFSKLKSRVYECASIVRRKFSAPPKIDIEYDRFVKRDYDRLVMEFPSNDYQRYIAKGVLKKTPKFTHENYKNLTKEEIGALRSEISMDTAFNAQLLVDNTKVTKQFLDKKYGKDSYVFVAGDDSYVPVAKCLEYLGVETADRHSKEAATNIKKVIFALGEENKPSIVSLEKIFNSKNHEFLNLTEVLRKSVNTANNSHLERTINHFETKRLSRCYYNYFNQPEYSYLERKFQFCILDILNQ